jgi:hypothetical protein
VDCIVAKELNTYNLNESIVKVKLLVFFVYGGFENDELRDRMRIN